jgi:Family of unknown function (DUF6328)
VIKVGNRLMIIGMAFVAIGMTGIFVFISDYLFGMSTAALAGCATAVIVTVCWFVLPLRHHARSRSQGHRRLAEIQK